MHLSQRFCHHLSDGRKTSSVRVFSTTCVTSLITEIVSECLVFNQGNIRVVWVWGVSHYLAKNSLMEKGSLRSSMPFKRPCTAHAALPDPFSDHCHACNTFAEICTRFVAVPLSDPLWRRIRPCLKRIREISTYTQYHEILCSALLYAGTIIYHCIAVLQLLYRKFVSPSPQVLCTFRIFLSTSHATPQFFCFVYSVCNNKFWPT
jgi:hypothetical protein